MTSPQPTPPYGYGPMPPQQKSGGLTALWIVLGVVGFILLGCCGFGVYVVSLDSDTDDQTARVTEPSSNRSMKCDSAADCPGGKSSKGRSGSDAGPTGSERNPAARGTSADNDSASYKILDVATPDNLGPYSDPASGQWVVVKLQVTNIKNQTIHIDSADLTLIVGGNEIDADDEGYVLDDVWSYEDLSPGLTKTGRVAFDVRPADAGKGVLQARAALSMDEPVYLSLQ